jgi:hypothetical protein
MKRFITIDNRKPVSMNDVLYFESIENWRDIPSIIFFFENKTSMEWNFESEKERDKAYKFLSRKYCINFKDTSFFKKVLKETRKELKKQFLNIIKKRKLTYKALPSDRPKLQISYKDHNNFKNKTLKPDNSYINPKSDISILGKITNYFK